MKTVGIIAEYNPFHNGHAYQIAKAKELSGADYCVVIMSGDFTQRGEPAIIDKYVRTKMALSHGADLIIELPVCFATGSAEYFAYGAVAILNALGVDTLCFGSECGDAGILKKAAKILTEEPAVFKELLQKNLKSGMSFPAARAVAVAAYCGEDAAELSTILQSSNNILGVEYLKALYRLNSSMNVHTIKRIGSSYNDNTISNTSFSSATAIRKHLFDHAALENAMPSEAYKVLKKHLEKNAPVYMDDFSSMLYYKLLSAKNDGYVVFSDITESISDKIINSLDSYLNITSFCQDTLKTKDLTLTRLNRCLLHILLDIKKTDTDNFITGKTALYARVLGFKKSSEEVFKALDTSKIPLVSKLADAEHVLSAKAMQMLMQDVFAAHLYEGVVARKNYESGYLTCSNKNGGSIKNEYRRKMIVLP